MTPEGKVKKKLDLMLKTYHPHVWFFSPQAGPYGVSGIPDRVGCAYGYMFGVEAKAHKGRDPTPLQAKCMNDIGMSGGRTFVVYDEDTIGSVQVWIDKLKADYESKA